MLQPYKGLTSENYGIPSLDIGTERPQLWVGLLDATPVFGRRLRPGVPCFGTLKAPRLHTPFDTPAMLVLQFVIMRKPEQFESSSHFGKSAKSQVEALGLSERHWRAIQGCSV